MEKEKIKMIEYDIEDTEEGLKKKLQILEDVIRKGARTEKIIRLARELTNHLENYDFEGELNSIFYWCKENIRYVRDITDEETIFDADRILEIGAGDCDDFVILSGALLRSIGFSLRFVILSEDSGKNWSHIYLQAWLDKWISLDASMGLEIDEELEGVKRYFLIE